MVDLVHADQPRSEFEHVVAQGDDDELRVLGALLDISSDNGDLQKVKPKISKHVHSTRSVSFQHGRLTFLKSSAASISSMTYKGVGL